MNWMKANVGKTLGDAIVAWKAIQEEKKNKVPKSIAPQFEYNTYIRDFLADNPTASTATAIQYWNSKRKLRGDKGYKKSDLGLLKDV